MSDKRDLNLAVIGNCQIAALIDSAGSIVWACLPRLDGDPVFSALLSPVGDTERGAFAIGLEGQARVSQRYLRNTAIVETLHDGQDATVKVTDFGPRFSSRERIYRPSMIIRIVEPVAGRPVIRVRLRPLGAYGSAVPRVTFSSHSVRFVADELTYRVTTDASLTAIHEERPFVLTCPLTFILGDDEPLTESPAAFGRSQLDQTRKYWELWVRGLAFPVDYQEPVIRAAITLKLCTFEDTGAVVAALTTSIPEAPDTIRNWDYRFCWLRDSYFTVHARIGKDQEARRWQEQAGKMHARIVAEAWSAKLNAFVATFGGDVLDATSLLFRSRHADDFGVPTTTFTVCAFWFVNALAAIRRLAEARELFGKLLARRNALGLLSEDIDPVTGELWGNYPQTYGMVGIIISALRLSRPWEEVV